MSAEAQRILVIQDASRDVSLSSLGWILQGFSLKSGDLLVLFGVLHPVNNPMGYKVKVDSNSMFGVNPKLVAEEVARKTEEYCNNVEIMKIAKQCEMEQIDFRIKVCAGSIPKVVALKAARSLKATWIILDRQMKKDKKYFMDKLSCGISRMKRDNTIEQFRRPRTRVNRKVPTERSNNSRAQQIVGYDEMIPGSPNHKNSAPKLKQAYAAAELLPPPKSSIEKEPLVDHGEEVPHLSYRKPTPYHKSSSNDQLTSATTSSSGWYNEASSSTFNEAKYWYMNFQEEETTTNTERETAGEQSPVSNAECPSGGKKACNTGSPNEEQKEQKNIDDWMGEGPTDEVFENSVCSICKNRRPKIGWKRDFTYAELHAATEGFIPKNFLSEGGFGSVYRGDLNGLKIAIKQHKSASFQGEKEFKSEVNVLNKARHENLVMLLGSCSEGNHRLLVYEYVCNGSLDQHLSKHASRPLSWEKRMKIAMGAAKGLHYLHENNIIHRDVRPNNILITHDHEALLGDFGLARTQHEDSEHSLETRVVGTLGYLAPEYAECGKVSTKTDVYSFGVLLLQLITGLKTTDKTLGGKSLVGWARPLLKERNYPDLIDQRIIDCHDVHQLFWMVRVAEKCLSKDPHKRLNMEKVACALNYIMESSTTCTFKDFFPAKSGSICSTPNSESQDDDTSFTVETTSTSFTSGTISSSTSHLNLRLPPSPPVRFLPSPSILAMSSWRSGASDRNRY